MVETIRLKQDVSLSTKQAECACSCGEVRFEIDVPARWAWHDHSRDTQRAHGSAYATYVGTWRSRLRLLDGGESISRFEDFETRSARSFCKRCGTPLFYERAHAPQMVNIPRALFATRTGREPRYHVALGEAPEWAYGREPLAPLKGYPGVMWKRPKGKKRREVNKGF